MKAGSDDPAFFSFDVIMRPGILVRTCEETFPLEP